MPRLSAQRLSGEEGVAACLRQGVLAGWVGEVVTTDFGEDLAFQISHKERVDPFRIYCQVKSFKRLPKKLTLRPEHLRKWLLHLEPVLLVVYDRSTAKLFGAPVSDHFRFLGLEDDNSVLTADLPELTVAELQRLAWRTRTRIFNFVARDLDGYMNELIRLGDEDDERGGEQLLREWADELYTMVWFLEYPGLVHRPPDAMVHTAGEPMRLLKELTIDRLSGSRTRLREPVRVLEACILTLLYEWQRISEGEGLPDALLRKAAGWLYELTLIELSRSGYDRKAAERIKIDLQTLKEQTLPRLRLRKSSPG